MYPHRIRLRGPWDCEPLSRTGSDAPLPPACRMTLPCRWHEGGLGDFAGRALFRRHFSWPGRIDAHERVWLTFGGVDGLADVWLNHSYLGRHEGDGPFAFDVTSLLQARNELRMKVEASGNGGIWGEVALEVRCTAFLRALKARLESTSGTPRLQVQGEVVGTCERPLELYVLLDGSTVIYTTIEALPQGRPFQVETEDLSLPPGLHTVRVDLINGAVIWYTVEQTL